MERTEINLPATERDLTPSFLPMTPNQTPKLACITIAPDTTTPVLVDSLAKT